MHINLEFRGRWNDIFLNLLLIGILSTITLGLYTPWGYARWKRMIATNTYFDNRPLQFDGSGGQAFVEFLIIGALSLITLGLYTILGFAGVRLLRWETAHTILPTGQRLEYRGGAIDLFFENFVLALFSALTLGIYFFWGYTRLRRHIITNTTLDGEPLGFTGSGVQFLVVALLNGLLSAITLGFYAILGFASVRQLRWEIENTLVPMPQRSRAPMPVISPPLSALSGGIPDLEKRVRPTGQVYSAAEPSDER
ncbi:MAG: DUF898 family protein [Chloroflexi bacterium]|nr:MAG: DUF898 family protein [Chloroflexota bacterium]